MEPAVHQVSERTFNRRKFFGYVILAVVTLSFAVLTYFAKTRAYFPLDLYLTRHIQYVDFVWFDWLMKTVSLIGNNPYSFIIVGIVCGIFLWRKHIIQGVTLGFSSIGAGVVAEIFKTYVSRVRPDASLIHQVNYYIRKDSFPSGHVLFFVGFFGFLLYLFYGFFPKGFLRNILISICIALLFLVGVSRIYLGAHWFSDVIGAYLLGFLWLTLVITIFNKIKKGSA